MANCKFIIHIDGVTQEFNSDEELNSFLRKKKRDLVNSLLIGTEVFSNELDPQESTVDILTKMSDSISFNKENHTLITSSGKDIYPVTKHIVEYRVEDFSGAQRRLVPEWKISKWEEDQRNVLGAIRNDDGEPRYTKEEITDIIKAKKKSFETVTLIGTSFHDIAEQFWKGVIQNVEDIEAVFPDSQLSLASRRKYLKSLQSLKDLLIERHGGDAAFLSEVKVVDNDPEAGRPIGGLIDLIVVDSKGDAYIYDYKTSSRKSDQWSSAKKLTIDYQLSYYRQILRRNKINVNAINYVPIKLNDVDYIDDVVHDFDMSTPRHLYIGEESFVMQNINRFLPYDASFKLEDIESNKNVHEFLKETYNYSHKNVDFVNQNVDSFVENIKNLQASNNYDSYVFVDYTVAPKAPNRRVWIPKTTSDDKFKAIVSDYLKRLDEYNKNLPSMIFSFIRTAKDDITRNEDVNWEVFRDNDTRAKMSRLLNDYIYDPDWVPLQVDALLDLGVAAFQNTATNRVDFISLTANKLEDTPTLLKGDSILGNFLTNRQAAAIGINRKASNGDIELMKVYALIKNNEDAFKGLTIGSIYAINMTTNKMIPRIHTQSIGVIENWYQLLIKNIPAEIELKNKDWEINSIDHFTDFVHMIDTILTDGNIAVTSKSKLFGMLEAIRGLSNDLSVEGKAKLQEVNAEKIKMLYDVIGILMDSLNDNLELGINSKDISQKRVANMIQIAKNAILQLSNETLSIEEDMKQFGSIFGSDNTKITTPGQFSDATVNMVHGRVQIALDNTFHSFNAGDKDYIRSLFAKLYEAESSIGRIKTVGDNIPVFLPMLRENDKGEKILVFKDPSDPTLTPAQSEFIKGYMSKVNEIRAHYIRQQDEDAYLDFIHGPTRYDIPLMRASSYSAMRNKNPKEFLRDYARDFLNPNNIYSDDESSNSKLRAQREMFNPFMTTDLDLEKIDARLSEQPLSEFEFDLEALLTIYTLAKHKEVEYNKQLPIINAAKISLMFDQYYGFADATNRIEHINNYIATVLYGNNILRGENEKIAIASKVTKDFTTIAIMGFSPLSGLTEMLTGLWNNFNRATTNRFDPDAYGFSDWMKAGAVVLGEINKGKLDFDNVSFCDNLNEMFSISEMDIKQIAAKMQHTSKAAVRHFTSEWMYWFNSFPSYMHRMTMFVAQMIKDGIVVTENGKVSKDSPLRVVNGRLIYDESKDGRFRLYLSNPNLEESKQTKEWKESRAKYLAIREEMSKEPGGIVNNKLARPYVNRQRDSMKAYADLTHGYYDTETKSEWEKTAFGRLFMHFKSWATAKKNRWYTETNPNTKQGKFIVEYDEQGNPKYMWKGKVMEGIIQSLSAFSNVVVKEKGNLIRAWAELEDYQKQNISWMAQDLLLYAVLLLIISLFSDSKDTSPGEQFAIKSLTNSAKDLFIFETVKTFTGDNNPLSSFSWMTKTLQDTWGFATGQNGPGQMFSNIGLYRTITGFIPDDPQ